MKPFSMVSCYEGFVGVEKTLNNIQIINQLLKCDWFEVFKEEVLSFKLNLIVQNTYSGVKKMLKHIQK